MSGYYWLASYPKSGNTWMRLALWALRHGKPVDFAEFAGWATVSGLRAVFDEVLGVESSDLNAAEIETLRPRVFETLSSEAPEPMLRKVHEPWILTPAGEPLFPPAVTLGAVYIVRDPRDVAVALSHHQGASLDRAIAFMSSPPHERGSVWRQMDYHWVSWHRHVESWLDAPGIRVLPVRYEDMVADMPAVLAEVAEFLGWDAEPEAVAAAVEATAFERLRIEEEKQGFGEKPLHMERFFRRGEAGGWRAVLSGEQAARIQHDHGAVMLRLGYL
ncbi:sulfotransferase domain-containing protein [Azospirillum sp.]|uniref:sulfotransferase domain-containing protein n=1 Tax=Azospirillum sp. TaxID=34012 RepID=UPI002D3B8ADD|nr:sulfotransferase domain-containing protein [Azospirillum sp.]HYD63943.1 sulfotransferase domain-containing protein [Azospirillum sp.]